MAKKRFNKGITKFASKCGVKDVWSIWNTWVKYTCGSHIRKKERLCCWTVKWLHFKTSFLIIYNVLCLVLSIFRFWFHVPSGEWNHLRPDGSDIGENCAGYYGNGEGSREVTVTAITLVSQVECLLELTRLCRQGHLTQEGIRQHIVIVDLKE